MSVTIKIRFDAIVFMGVFSILLFVIILYSMKIETNLIISLATGVTSLFVISITAYVSVLRYRAVLSLENIFTKLFKENEKNLKIDFTFVLKNRGREPMEICDFNLMYTDFNENGKIYLKPKEESFTKINPSCVFKYWVNIVVDFDKRNTQPFQDSYFSKYKHDSLVDVLITSQKDKIPFWFNIFENGLYKDKRQAIFLKIKYEGANLNKEDVLCTYLSFRGVYDGNPVISDLSPSEVKEIKNKLKRGLQENKEIKDFFEGNEKFLEKLNEKDS